MSFRAKRRISDHFFCLPGKVVQLWLLFPVVTQIQPSRIHLCDEGNFAATAPAVEFLFTGNRVVHVANVLDPNEAGQVVALRKAVHLAISVLIQTRVMLFVIPCTTWCSVCW